jgi:hypothetical protein
MRLVCALLLLLLPLQALAETRLLMAEEHGCIYCARWNAEIGPIYPKTAEGKAAPLTRFDIIAPPKEVRFARRVVFTPTFVLVDDNVEVARIEGYPGEDFFWGLLAEMLRQAQVDTAPAG